MKNLHLLFIVMTVIVSNGFAVEPRSEAIRCYVRSNDFVQSGLMRLNRFENELGIQLYDRVPIEITRAFKEFGVISKFEEVVSFTASWRECKSTSLKGWYRCSGELPSDYTTLVARHQDSDGTIHERTLGYPKGLKASITGNIHGWTWKFEMGDKVFTSEAELVACQYRAYTEDGH